MSLLNFQLVTPERTVLSEELVSLTCPTTLGQITILPGHIPLVATLSAGELIVKTQTGEYNLHVSGGFIEVRDGNHVVALADAAEHFYDIDEERAKTAIARAKQTMQESNKLADEEYAAAAAALERAFARLNIVRKHAHRKSHPITSEGILKNNAK